MRLRFSKGMNIGAISAIPAIIIMQHVCAPVFEKVHAPMKYMCLGKLLRLVTQEKSKLATLH